MVGFARAGARTSWVSERMHRGTAAAAGFLCTPQHSVHLFAPSLQRTTPDIAPLSQLDRIKGRRSPVMHSWALFLAHFVPLPSSSTMPPHIV